MTAKKCLPALIAAALLAGCGESEPRTVAPSPSAQDAGRLSVFVVNYPLQYFAERIGGDGVAVVFPAPQDEDPAYWSPDPDTVAAYQEADLILLNGAGYAGWVQRSSLPRARLVDTSASFHDQLIPLEKNVTHSHGPEGAHTHRGTAFTTWLDPGLAILQARAVRDAFAKARPDREAAFQQGFEALEADLRDLDQRLATAAEAIGDAPLTFSHPVYQYLARRYGLNARSVHWEPDRPPSETMWRELGDLVATHPARWMVWEDQPIDATLKRLEAMGLGSVVFAPCATAPEKGDYLSVMRENAARLDARRQGLRGASPQRESGDQPPSSALGS
jgi:zinc transport system substrate-binding protein